MSYVDNNLLPDEKVVYRAHLHWAIYIPAIVCLALGIEVAPVFRTRV
jgi:hypothetical protein